MEKVLIKLVIKTWSSGSCQKPGCHNLELMSTDVFAEGDSALKETLSNEITLEITGEKTHQTDEVDVEVQIFNPKSQNKFSTSLLISML